MEGGTKRQCDRALGGEPRQPPLQLRLRTRQLRLPSEKDAELAQKLGQKLGQQLQPLIFSYIPTGMHGPACVFWANLTPSSLDSPTADGSSCVERAVTECATGHAFTVGDGTSEGACTPCAGSQYAPTRSSWGGSSQVLSPSDHAPPLLFIRRFVWGGCMREQI